MFQDARDSNLNLVAMGGQLDAYRAALESRYELDTDGRDLEAFLIGPDRGANRCRVCVRIRRPGRRGPEA